MSFKILKHSLLSRFYDSSRKVTSSANTQKQTTKIKRLLVAGHGENAIRVMKTARRMGIETVAVYSNTECSSMHRLYADHLHELSPSLFDHCYRNYENVFDAAEKTKVQAIFPANSFLNENAKFAELCALRDLKFIGPSPKILQMITSLKLAKQLIANVDVPIAQSYYSEGETNKSLQQKANEIGFPVLLKTSNGDGRRGTITVWNEYEFTQKLDQAKKLFGGKETIIEKYIVHPRHIEVQVIGDSYGNYVHFWERDCSIEHGYRRIIEEAPAINLSHEVRYKLVENALRVAQTLQYVGMGTVEFILDKNGTFYFNEINAQFQAEHAATEEAIGIDLVEWQLRVAQGEQLPKSQDKIVARRHAVETRIYAEDTDDCFAPLYERLKYVSFPSTVRIDTGIQEGNYIGAYYHPRIAKVITTGQNRQEAIEKMKKALEDTHIAGPATNQPLIQSILKHEDYIEGNLTTAFVKNHERELQKMPEITQENICEYVIARLLLAGRGKVTSLTPRQNHRANLTEDVNVKLGYRCYLVEILDETDWIINIDGRIIWVEIIKCHRNKRDFVQFEVSIDGKKIKRTAVKMDDRILIFGGEGQRNYRVQDSISFKSDKRTEISDAYAPSNGLIEEIFMKEGDQLNLGDPILAMASKTMEYLIRSPFNAIVQSILCSVGKNVEEHEQLIKFVETAIHLQRNALVTVPIMPAVSMVTAAVSMQL